MSDLIERLRGYDTVFQTAHEAADELERLTKENEEHIRQINLRNDTIDGLRAELDSLKQQLAEAQTKLQEAEKEIERLQDQLVQALNGEDY